IVVTEAEAMAQCGSGRKEAAGKCLIYDGDERTLCRVLSVEVASCEERDPECAQVLSSNDVVEYLFAVFRSAWHTLHQQRVGPLALVEGEHGKAGRLHARQRLHALFNLLLELDEARVQRQIGRVLVEGEDKDVLGGEAGIDAGEIIQATQKESCRREEQNRKDDLPHNERAGKCSSPRSRGTSTPFLKGWGKFQAGRTERPR